MIWDGSFVLDIEQPASLPERKLAEEIAGLIAEGLWDDLGPPDADGTVYNIGMSNYEAACQALNLVNVYQQREHYTVHHVVVSVEAVRTHVAALEAVSKKALDELLSAFIANFIGHWGTLSGTRQKFAPPDNLSKVLILLAKCGYAKQVGEDYQWSDKIGPLMQRWYIWTEADVSSFDIAQTEYDAQSKAMAATMPETVKRKVRAKLAAGSSLRAISVIKKHWDGERWLTFPKRAQEGKSTSDLDMGTAKALLEILGGPN